MDAGRDHAAAPETAEAILASWRDGRLGVPGGGGETSIDILGIGESYAAWRLTAADGADLTLRVATRPPDDMPRPTGQEAAALPYVPPGAGPRLVTARLDGGPLNPLGSPYIVTTHQPGRLLAPRDWTATHLRAHAAALARLHRSRFAGRGEFLFGADPLRGLVPGPMSLVTEFDTAMAWWRDHHPDLWRDPEVAELATAARSVCAAAEPAFGELDSYPLVHGDLCATNVLWEGDTPHFIDFEWSQADDPARDLAIIGGPVHAGPWYLPLDDRATDHLLDGYVEASAEFGHDFDRTALRRRRDGWEAYERTAMLLYVMRRAREGRAGFDRIARDLGARLATTLRARRRV